jgi:hypothetical protein
MLAFSTFSYYYRSDDCECKRVSAVAHLLKKFITERDTKNLKPGVTSGRNTKVDCETQTEANSRQRVW